MSGYPPGQSGRYYTPGPSRYPTGPSHPPPGLIKTYYEESLICLVASFGCCTCGWIFAIPAFVFASMVKSRLKERDYAGAYQASQAAKMWLIVSIVAAVISGVCVVVIFALRALAEQMVF